MIEWLIQNKEWVFSGLGIAVISAIFAIIKAKKFKSDKNIVKNSSVIQITNVTSEKEKSNIKIVDISFPKSGDFIIDIKLRNIGDQVTYIKEIAFDILDYYSMGNPQVTQYQLIPSSNTYDVVLGKKERQIFKISQGIGANEVDRFQIKMASSIPEPRMPAIYYLFLSIIYDEDSKVEKSEKHIWAVPSNRKWAGCYVSHMDMEIAKKNYLELKRFDSYDGRKSEHFVNILESYEKNKSDFLKGNQ